MDARINLGSSPLDQACRPCLSDFDAMLAQSADLAAAWGRLPRRVLHPGQALVHSGQNVRHAWRIESGLFRIYYLSPQGQSRNRSFHAAGKWLGAGIPPGEVSSPFTIEALERSVAVELSYATWREWLSAHPRLTAAMHGVLAAIFLRQSEREAELLLLDATERYRAFLAYYGEVAARVPLHHVASYLGITNVALSRIRRTMK